MGEPNRQYQPVDLLEFKRRLQARVESARTSNENPLEELARIIGGNGHIIPANADARSESVFEKTEFAEAPVETSSDPESALVAADTASTHNVTDEQAADLPTDDIESDRAKWTPPSDQAEQDGEFEASRPAFDVGWQDPDAAIDHEGEALEPTQSSRAYLRLRHHRRRSMSLYATSAVALVVAGALVAVFVRPGVSVGVAPALGPTSTAMVIRPSLQPDAVPASQPAPSKSAAVASGAELSSVSAPAQSDPVSPASTGSASAPASDADTNAAAAPTAVPQDSATSADSLFFQPRRVQTIPVYSDGSYASPSDATPTAGNAGAEGEAAGAQTAEEAQRFQLLTTQAAPTPDSPPPASDAPPADDQGQTVASREPSATVPRAASKPAPVRSGAGGDAAAILASTKVETDARAMLGTLQKKYGAALAGHRLTYHRVKHSGGTAFEVRVAGLGKADAQALCDKVTKAGGSCQLGAQ